FRIVIRIDFPQRLVKYECKFVQAGGLCLELDNPFMAALLALFKIHWRCCKVADLGASLCASACDGRFGIFHDDLLSECVHEMLCAARDPDAKRRERRKLY